MKRSEILKAARQLISDPGHWTQGSLARDACNKSVSPISPEAVCWCAYGALAKVLGRNPREDTTCGSHEIDRLIRRGAPKRSVLSVNDVGTHEDVMRLFDKAIAAAERAE